MLTPMLELLIFGTAAVFVLCMAAAEQLFRVYSSRLPDPWPAVGNEDAPSYGSACDRESGSPEPETARWFREARQRTAGENAALEAWNAERKRTTPTDF